MRRTSNKKKTRTNRSHRNKNRQQQVIQQNRETLRKERVLSQRSQRRSSYREERDELNIVPPNGPGIFFKWATQSYPLTDIQSLQSLFPTFPNKMIFPDLAGLLDSMQNENMNYLPIKGSRNYNPILFNQHRDILSKSPIEQQRITTSCIISLLDSLLSTSSLIITVKHKAFYCTTFNETMYLLDNQPVHKNDIALSISEIASNKTPQQYSTLPNY